MHEACGPFNTKVDRDRREVRVAVGLLPSTGIEPSSKTMLEGVVRQLLSEAPVCGVGRAFRSAFKVQWQKLMHQLLERCSQGVEDLACVWMVGTEATSLMPLHLGMYVSREYLNSMTP